MMSTRSPVCSISSNTERQEAENHERYTVKQTAALSKASEHENKTRTLVATRHVEMLLPPVIGTTTFSSETKPHMCATSLTRNSATQGMHGSVKSQLPIDKPIRILEPIECNIKNDIYNRLSSSSSCNALSSTTTSMSQDNTLVSVELGESTTVNDTSVLSENDHFNISNKNTKVTNRINVTPTSPKWTSQTCNNAMSTAVTAMVDDESDAWRNILDSNTNRTNTSPFAKHTNAKSSQLQEMKNNNTNSSKVRLLRKRKTKKSSPHYVFERLTLANTKASLERNEENQAKQELEFCPELEKQERVNYEEKNTVNNLGKTGKSSNSKTKVVDAKGVCIISTKENNEQDADEAERQRIALLQQFHHDVDVIENKGKELIRSHTCSSALLASSLSKWRERMNTSSQEICMANSFVIHDFERKNNSSNFRDKSHFSESSSFCHQRSNTSGSNKESRTKINGDYNNTEPMSYVRFNEKEKQLIVPLHADSDTEEEEQEIYQKEENAFYVSNDCTEGVNCANVNEHTKALDHKAFQETNQMYIDGCNNQSSNNTKDNKCGSRQHLKELSPTDNKCHAAKEICKEIEYENDDMDDVTFSFTQYRKSSVRLSRSPSRTGSTENSLIKIIYFSVSVCK